MHDNPLYHALCHRSRFTAHDTRHVLPLGPGVEQEF
jgi:hypothetical protein